MKTSTGKNPPRIEPAVEIELTFPAVRPVPCTELTSKRTEKGETHPSKITGIAKSKIIPNNDPKKRRPLPVLKPCWASPKNGLLKRGIRSIHRAENPISW